MTAEVVVEVVRHVSQTFVRHHGLRPPATGDRFQVEPARAQGGFGAVREVVGAPTPLLLKVYDPVALAASGGAAAIERAVSSLDAALDGTGVAAWPDALRAFPYWLAEARVDGAPVLVALMLDLAPAGYESYRFDPAAANAHRKLPIEARVELAHRFGERCALLERAGFLHGDLNPENLLVHLGTRDVQVIDLDAGAVGTHPLTAGKADDCMPPEVRHTAGAGGVDITAYTAGAERWSVGTIVGYFLLGAHPGFFLRSMASKVLEEYARTHPGWPEIDQGGPLFSAVAVNQRAYDRMRREMVSWPAGVQDLFRCFFAAGLRGLARPSAGEWVRALADSQRPPVIDLVVVDPEVCPEGTEVTISWRSSHGTGVEVVGIGTGPPDGSMRTRVTKSCSFLLRATNPYGVAEVRSPAVRVVALPPIDLRYAAPPLYRGRVDVAVAAAPAITTSSVGRPPTRPSSGLGPIGRPPRAPGRPSGLTAGPGGRFPRR